jgi:hypothetical protein
LEDKKATLYDICGYIAGRESKLHEALEDIRQACEIESGDSITPSLMRWENIREMQEHRISFGGHTATHKRVSFLSTEGLQQEVIESKKLLDERLGKKAFAFAYPYGREVDYNRSSMEAVKNAGYSLAVTAVTNSFSSTSSMEYEVPRVNIDRADSMKVFRRKTSSWFPPIYHGIRKILGKDKEQHWVS